MSDNGFLYLNALRIQDEIHLLENLHPSIRVEDFQSLVHPRYPHYYHQKCLRAIASIPQDECLGSYAGEVKSIDDFEEWDRYSLQPFPNSTYFITSAQYGNAFRFMNDYRYFGGSANCVYDGSSRYYRGKRTVKIYTLRNISAGEELTIDYGDEYWEEYENYLRRNFSFHCYYTGCEKHFCSANDLTKHVLSNHYSVPFGQSLKIRIPKPRARVVIVPRKRPRVTVVPQRSPVYVTCSAPPKKTKIKKPI